MEVTCIRPFGDCKVGDTRVVPDGASVSPHYWSVVTKEAPPVVPEGETDDTDLDPAEAERRKQIRDLEKQLAELQEEE